MLQKYRRERNIRRLLRKLARQRVALVLQPGNVLVIERAIGHDPETLAALQTCHMRGWVEPMFDQAIPQGTLLPNGDIPTAPPFDRANPIYRLTDSGWSVINRSHEIALLGVIVALAGAIVALVAS